jgi:hypothetical protein
MSPSCKSLCKDNLAWNDQLAMLQTASTFCLSWVGKDDQDRWNAAF